MFRENASKWSERDHIPVRTIILENCEYNVFAETMDAILECKMPFILINQYYSQRRKEGFFNFWDSDYIPDQMQQYILHPPEKRENVKKLDEILSKIEYPVVVREVKSLTHSVFLRGEANVDIPCEDSRRVFSTFRVIL